MQDMASWFLSPGSWIQGSGLWLRIGDQGSTIPDSRIPELESSLQVPGS